MNSNWDKVIADSDLVSLPQVYLKLQQVLYSEEFSMQDVTDVISLDPAITARLLRMVNSSFFGLAASIETVSHAVNYLGAQQIHDLVLTASIARTFSDLINPDFNLNEFWKSSVYNAIAARELAAECNLIDSERLFVSGLLSHIGELMIFNSLPELSKQAVQRAEQAHKPQYMCEREVLEFDYAMVGAYLLSSWHLPESLTEAIKYQTEPAKNKDFTLETSILHIAAEMASAYDHGWSIEEHHEHLDAYALDNTGTSIEKLMNIDTTVRQSISSVIHMLFPQ